MLGRLTCFVCCLCIGAAGHLSIERNVHDDLSRSRRQVEIDEINYENLPHTKDTHGLLYPRESESREVRILDGMWRFVKSNESDPMQGVREKWFEQPLEKCGRTVIDMPVPASYNDITTDALLRDHVGTVWYERAFFVPRSWEQDQRIWLRFGSVHYAAVVYLNGEAVVSHFIGHLPFEAQITPYVKFGKENRLTVLCDNTLNNATIPQGKVIKEPADNGSRIVQTYTFDFFNYAGIHRSVHLYTTPAVYIEDIVVTTDIIENGTGVIQYNVSMNGAHTNSIEEFVSALMPLYLHVQLRDKLGDIVAKQKVNNEYRGSVVVPNVNAWWPYLMHDQPGYLYQLEFYLHAADNSLLDVYRLPVGVRTLSWTNTSLLINGVPVYMRGFGRHEDADIRGKGFDYALLTRDFNLLQWIGANAYRTSHYPYSEESMQFADAHGIMIIDECPSVNTDIFETALLMNHKSALEQLIHRDRNHPSVVAWSIANEPRSTGKQAEDYFRHLVNYTRGIAAGRPITAALNTYISKDVLAQFLDVISFNRYNAWYHNAGHLDMINQAVYDEAISWHDRYKRPVLMSEYGADTMEGMHSLPNYIWSEDYQSALVTMHFKAFDRLRKHGWFIGEFVWNFADFKTEQTFTRVGGNKKGVFTRSRQPKAAANLLRQRYFALAQGIDQIAMPDDIFPYIVDWRPEL